MATWASRRKTVFALIFILVIVIPAGYVAFRTLYKAPTCFDLKQNGDEFGIDCGGSCVKLCQSAFLPPRIQWGGAKLEKIADGVYNTASYIVNPNITGAAINVPYKMSLYDKEGILIVERHGKVTLYPHRNSLAFQPSIKTDLRVPSKATFEFTSMPVWFKSNDELGGISVIDKKYTEDENGSSLEVYLENKTLYDYKDVVVAAILSDEEGNVIGFSQTNLDKISAKNGREVAPFTWPLNHNGKVTTIEVLPIIKPVMSR